jgi:hypothetical protein
MSYYDNYASLNEVWGRVPNYAQYSEYQSDKNEYGTTFTSFDRKGPQLNRDFRRTYDISRNYEPTVSPSIRPIANKFDEYKTKISYGPDSYPNTYPMEYFTHPFTRDCDDRKMIKFYNRAILIVVIGLLIKWLLDTYK